MNLQRMVFSRIYRRAPTVESLPWHRERPPVLLEQAVAQRTTPGHALDLGCGQGVHAMYLAQQGFSVVGVDFVRSALAVAKSRAKQAGVEVDLRECDVVDFEAPVAFDVVLDSGCLHHLPRTKTALYHSRTPLRPVSTSSNAADSDGVRKLQSWRSGVHGEGPRHVWAGQRRELAVSGLRTRPCPDCNGHRGFGRLTLE